MLTIRTRFGASYVVDNHDSHHFTLNAAAASEIEELTGKKIEEMTTEQVKHTHNFIFPCDPVY